MSTDTDYFTRQQVYVEFLKNDEAEKADELNDAILAVLVALLAKAGYDTLSDMPKKELRAFIAKVNAQLAKVFKNFKALTIQSLKAIVDADVEVTTAIFQKLTGKPKINLSHASMNRRLLWAKITNDVIAGAGETPLKLLSEFFATVTADVRKLILRAYADGMSIKEITALITGTKAAGYKDGLLRKVRNSWATMTDTIIQHVSSYIGELFGKMFYEYYEWVSIIDSRTTDICRHRDGKVYRYGHGPRPPAHHRCRSRIRPLPVPANTPDPMTYFQWIKEQPAEVQDDILGKDVASRLRDGELGSRDFPRFVSSKRLTPKGYKDKRRLLLT